jgi:hypothetical protein
MASEEQLLQAKAFLMQAEEDGSSVYDHLQRVMLKALADNPQDVVSHPEKLSEISVHIKRHDFSYGERSSEVNCSTTIDGAVLARHERNKALFSRPPPEVTTTIEQPTPFTTVTTTTVKPPKAPPFASVVAQNNLWRHAGFGLPDREAFLLDLSISKLAQQKNLEEVRFIGKIFGTKANYFVCSSRRYVAEDEKVFQEVNEMPKPPRKKVEVDLQPEPGFKGCNRLSFWVTAHPGAEWELLPDTTPQLINAARRVKKLMTGDLSAPVVCSPAFPGNEAAYLRAQLSRLLSATYISPANALEKVEAEEEEAEEEEDEAKKKAPKEAKYTPLTKVSKEYAPDEEQGVHALADLEQWVHSEGYIYENGRQTKVPEKPEVEGEENAEEEPKDEEEEEEAEVKEEEEKELFIPIKKDHLFAVITLPKEPNADDGEEEPEPEPEDVDGEEKEEEESKPLEDEDIPDDDPLKKKITAWSAKIVNNTFKKHSVVVVKSLRWPGSVAFAANGGKEWGCVYFGTGLKKTDHAFTPIPAPQVLQECADIFEVADATAATEKLVLRGEEPKENDSEDEKEEEEPEEEA